MRHPKTGIWAPGFGHQGLVAACALLGVSPGCIFPTGCPAEEPTRRGCTTWGCAPRCCSQRLLVSRCILSIGRPAKTISPQCAIGIRYSLFHYGQGYALSSRHFVRLKGFHGTEECAERLGHEALKIGSSSISCPTKSLTIFSTRAAPVIASTSHRVVKMIHRIYITPVSHHVVKMMMMKALMFGLQICPWYSRRTSPQSFTFGTGRRHELSCI